MIKWKDEEKKKKKKKKKKITLFPGPVLENEIVATCIIITQRGRVARKHKILAT
jgi:hypothetical protein